MLPLESYLESILYRFAESAGILLLGVTLLLMLGSIAVAVVHSPVQRQRIADLTVCATLVLLLLALVPLPRPAAEWWTRSAKPSNTVEASEPRQPRPAVTNDRRHFPTPEELAVLAVEPVPAIPTQPDLVSDELTILNASIHELDQRIGEAKSQQDGLHPSTSWLVAKWLIGAWLVGAAAAAGWLALGRILLLRIIRTRLPVPQWLEGLWQTLPWSGGVRPQLVLSTRIGRAMTWGLWRATIALPAVICRPKRADQLRHILLHELGHILRGDAWSVLLFNLALPLLYFHPLFWYLRSQSRLSAELLADDWAAGHSSPETYVQELIAFVKAGKKDHALAFAGLGFFENPTRFYRRMSMLLHRQERLPTRCGWLWRCAAIVVVVTVIAVAVSSVGLAPATAQAPDTAAETLKQIDALVEQLSREKAKVEQESSDRMRSADDEIAKLREECKMLNAQVEKLTAHLAKLEQAQFAEKNSRIEKRGIWTDERMKQLETAKMQLAEQADVLAAQRSEYAKLAEMQKAQALLENERAMMAKRAADEALQAAREAEKAARAEAENIPFFNKREEFINSFRGAAEKAAAEKAVADQRRAEAEQEYLRRKKDERKSIEPKSEEIEIEYSSKPDSLNVLTLATSLIDAQSDLEEAKNQLQHLTPLHEKGFVDQTTVLAAESKMRRASRKVELLVSMAELSLEAAQQDAEIYSKQVEAGILPVHEATQAKYRLRMLERILESARETNEAKQTPKEDQGATLKPDFQGVVVQIEDPSTLKAYEPKTRNVLWSSKLGNEGELNIIAVNVTDKHVTVAADNGMQWILDAATGEVLQENKFAPPELKHEEPQSPVEPAQPGL